MAKCKAKEIECKSCLKVSVFTFWDDGPTEKDCDCGAKISVPDDLFADDRRKKTMGAASSDWTKKLSSDHKYAMRQMQKRHPKSNIPGY